MSSIQLDVPVPRLQERRQSCRPERKVVLPTSKRGPDSKYSWLVALACGGVNLFMHGSSKVMRSLREGFKAPLVDFLHIRREVPAPTMSAVSGCGSALRGMDRRIEMFSGDGRLALRPPHNTDSSCRSVCTLDYTHEMRLQVFLS